jgi:dihydrofolate reductase
MNQQELCAVVAVAKNGVIGRNNQLPWRLKADLQRFKKLTMGHTLIMGRKTFDSIGKPLGGRTTIVLSRSRDFSSQVDGVITVDSIENALRAVPPSNKAFVVGGAEIYKVMFPLIQHLYITHVLEPISGDATLPEWDASQFTCVDELFLPADATNEWPTHFQHLVRKL